MHLAEYMQLTGLTDKEVGKAIKRSIATVNRIRNRVVRPDWDTIRSLRKFTKGAVTADDFVDVD